MDLDEQEETEEQEMESSKKRGHKAPDAMRGQVAVWSFKSTTQANAATKSAAADANAFSVHFGKHSAEATSNRTEFSARCKNLELSRVSIELHQVSFFIS